MGETCQYSILKISIYFQLIYICSGQLLPDRVPKTSCSDHATLVSLPNHVTVTETSSNYGQTPTIAYMGLVNPRLFSIDQS